MVQDILCKIAVVLRESPHVFQGTAISQFRSMIFLWITAVLGASSAVAVEVSTPSQLYALPLDTRVVVCRNLAATSIARLGQLGHLESVALVFCEIDSASMQALAAAPIKELRIEYCKNAQSGKLSLDHFKSLVSISICQLEIDGELFVRLARLPALREFELSNVNGARMVMDRDLEVLGLSQTLTCVRLLTGIGINLTDRGISALCAGTRLEVLYVDGLPHLSTQCFRAVSRCREMRVLGLGNDQLLDDLPAQIPLTLQDESDLLLVTQLPKLEECNLDCRVGAGNAAFIGLLVQRRTIKRLSVRGCPDFDNDGCRWLATIAVEEIDCRDCHKVDDDGVGALVSIPTLRCLRCGSTSLPGTIKGIFSQMKVSPLLEELALDGFDQSPEGSISVIITNAPLLRTLRLAKSVKLDARSLERICESEIQVLDLRGCQWVDAKALQRLCAMKHLVRIVLRGCNSLNKADVENARAALPGCEIIG